MSMKFKETNYGNFKNILAVANHHVAIGFLHKQRTALDSGVSVNEDGKWIVKAGTIYPSNDANALGVVLQDYDVTNSDENIAVVVHGFIKSASLPEALTDEAKASLNQITFI